MRPHRVENMGKWLDWKKRITNAGFHIWQTQYGWNSPEGLIVGFFNSSNGERFEIVTHSKEIAEDITHSGL